MEGGDEEKRKKRRKTEGVRESQRATEDSLRIDEATGQA
jgi:hypothetical protein